MKLEDRIAVANSRNRKSRDRKKAKAVDKVQAQQVIYGLWLEWQRDQDWQAVPLNIPERATIQMKWKAHMRDAKNDPNFYRLFEWSVKNWRAIMGDQFRGMANPPNQPVAKFFVKCLPQFIQAYRKKEDVLRHAEMTTREVMIEKIMKRSGKSQEVAEAEVDERLGLTRLKADIQEERRRLQQLQNRNAETEAVSQRLRLLERRRKRTQARAEKDVIENEYDKWV